MSDLISRNALLEEHCDGCPAKFAGTCSPNDPVCGLAQLIYEAPAVDAVEVVRCKDCKHRYQYEDWDRQQQEVIVCYECRLLRKDFGDGGFCPRGERRDGE